MLPVEEQDIRIGLDELRELCGGEITIDKKYVLINSSMYTDEAFDYLLSLADSVGAIVFVSDRRKIYAMGEYFGGDLWHESLYYFSEIELSQGDTITGTITTDRPLDTLRFKGHHGITLNVEEYDEKQYISIGYDVKATVDESTFSIEPESLYQLKVNDEGRISMQKFTPIKLWLESDTPDKAERDSGYKPKEYFIQYTGTNTPTNIEVNVNKLIRIYRTDTGFTCMIPENTDATFTVTYLDGEEEKTYTKDFTWHLACVYGTDEINSETFYNFERHLIDDELTFTVNIDQGNNNYGWFACPAEYKITFTDDVTKMSGGWEKVGTETFYYNNIPYNIYRTENEGLGNVDWIITLKK